MKRVYSAPTATNLELTEACNVRCKHCYNYWREDSMGGNTLSIEKLDVIIDKIIDAGVFHAILSGGEPLAKIDLLVHGLKRLQEANISTSVNSNLMLITEEKARRLTEAGLDHILTSVPSHDPEVNDDIMVKEGSLGMIIKGIKIATANGIRVSANHVITQGNYEHVYATAKLCAELGVQKIFVTRGVPPVYSKDAEGEGYLADPVQVKEALDAAIRAKEDFGIKIGSLVSYPLCFFGDLVKYKDFVGRGCPAQRGTRFSVNATGETHACVHEEDGYGNIFENSIPELYRNMKQWHDGSLHYEGCEGCHYQDVCESGCRMSAKGFYGKHKAKDPLFVGPHAFTRHYEMDPGKVVEKALLDGAEMIAPKRLRFRAEEDFYLLNIRWGNTINIPTDVALFLQRYQESGDTFTMEDFGRERIEMLVGLVVKDAVEAPALDLSAVQDETGLSMNLESLFR